MKRLVLSWNEVYAASLILCGKIPLITAVVPVSRGGLVPASILAYELKARIPFSIDPICPEFVMTTASDLLIVDDVCDTGATFRGLRRFFPNALFAAPYAKPAGRDACELSAVDVEQDTWIVFPWAPKDVPR